MPSNTERPLTETVYRCRVCGFEDNSQWEVTKCEVWHTVRRLKRQLGLTRWF